MTTEKIVTVSELFNNWSNDNNPWYRALGFHEAAPGFSADYDDDGEFDQALLDAHEAWEASLLSSLAKYYVWCWWADGITPRFNTDGSYELMAAIK